MVEKIRKAVIPAAGYGTRFLPATKATPKEMLPIVDKPVIQYIVEEAVQSGIEEILIVSGHGKRAIEDHFDTNIELETQLQRQGKLQMLHMIQEISAINVYYIRQKHVRGLGDAVYCAKDFVDDEPFAVLLGDDIVYRKTMPALRQLMDQYDQLGTTILGYQMVAPEDVSSYGIVEGTYLPHSNCMRVTNVMEKPLVTETSSRNAIMGRYIITPDIFDALQRTQPGLQGELQLTDALKLLVDREAVYASPLAGTCYNVGHKLGYLRATVEYALRRDELKGAFGRYLSEILDTDIDDK
jgi:UTP--glucose-1-phosphate uridylyltransferase